MNPALERVLQEVHANDLEIRHRAVGQIGLLLEKNTAISGTVDSYKDLLDDDLFTLKLDVSEQQRLVAELCNLIASDKMTIGMLWALGKADRTISIRPLFEIIRNQSRTFGEEALWQTLVTLDNVIILSGTAAKLQEQNRLIDEYGIIDWLYGLEHLRDPRVPEKILGLKAAIRDSKGYKYVE
ncbi:MAG: hypothetical protein MI924_20500 [Chloroflexales bacterium]|nr:hypothetical protein [Chloroflexales bacterium]